MIEEEYRGARQWSRNQQAIAIVVWISFLLAAVGTMLFFAVFDPVELADMAGSNLDISRDAGYAIGFFFFWMLTAACAAITAFLVRTSRKRDQRHR